jgi:hypothetical protein
MSKIEKDKCDLCGKETDDRYAELGWIRLKDISNITISLGRGKDRCAKTKFKGNVGTIDFCSTGCLIEFIKTFK